MIYVPVIDQLTQARHAGEIELIARELIAVSTDTPIREITVRAIRRPNARNCWVLARA